MADEDIIELTQVVKEGNSPARAMAGNAPASTEAGLAPPLPADFAAGLEVAEDIPAAPVSPAASAAPDFGADLDALLQSYDAQGDTALSAAQAEPVTPQEISPQETSAQAPVETVETVLLTTEPPVLPTEAIAAPIANQDDSGRAVDPNEELDLPPLSDLDALLEELGVQDSSALASSATVISPGHDLDAGPVSDVEANPSDMAATEKSANPSSEVDLAAVAAGVAASKAETARNGEMAEVDLSLEDLADADAAIEESGNLDAQAEMPAEDEVEGIDLNELDALLDSVLASAPRPAIEAPAGNQPLEAAPAQEIPAASPTIDGSELDSLRGEVASLKAEIADLRANIDKIAAAAAAKVIREEISNLAEFLD